MKVSVSKVDHKNFNLSESLGDMEGWTSTDDENRYDFKENNEFTINDDVFVVEVEVLTDKSRGNLSIKKNGDDFLKTIMGVDGDGFLLTVNVSSDCSLEVLVNGF